jgi:hypothetical protein
MDNCNAHAYTHKNADNRVRLLPFVGQLQGESFEEFSCFTPKQTISGDNKRREVLALFQTGLQILLLFLALLRGQDFVGVLGPIWLGVCICHADINNDIRPPGPEALCKEISLLFLA